MARGPASPLTLTRRGLVPIPARRRPVFIPSPDLRAHLRDAPPGPD